MLDHSLTPEPLPHPQLREFEDCVIALHDALEIVGDREGRELLECVLRRFERAVSEASTPKSANLDEERGGAK